MGLRNYKESVHLKEQEASNTTLIACFTNQGSYQQHPSTSSQDQPNTAMTNQVSCWKCGHYGHISADCPGSEREEKQAKQGKRGKAKQKNDSGKSAGETNNNQGNQDAHVLTILATGTTDKEVINGWIWDTSADVHICKDKSLMTDVQHASGRIQQAQGPLIKYNTVRKVTLSVNTSTSIKNVTLSNVVLLHNGNFNLSSPRAAAKASEGDIRCDRQGRDCIMVGKNQQHKQVAQAIKCSDRLCLDVVAKIAPSNHAMPSEQD